MNRRATLLLTRVWYWIRRYSPHTLLIVVVMSLLWIAAVLAIRSGLFVPSDETPGADQIKVFLAFVGGGLGTAATVFTALITREHNERERDRLRLETVINSLQSLPPSPPGPRVAGVLATMVLLGHERVGIRVLEPAWEANLVDDATATWLIGQVMTGHPDHTGRIDEAEVNEAAVNEAAVILRIHADDLASADRCSYNFPGPYLRNWRVGKELPHRAKDNLLRAMAQVLLSRPPQWWSRGGDVPKFPTESLAKCLGQERDPVIRASAATLLEAIRSRFPDTYDGRFCAGRQRLLRVQAHDAEKGKDLVPDHHAELARRIRDEWGRPVAQDVPAGGSVRSSRSGQAAAGH